MGKFWEKHNIKEGFRDGLTIGAVKDMQEDMAVDLAKKIFIRMENADKIQRVEIVGKLQKSLSEEARQNPAFVRFTVNYLKTNSSPENKRYFDQINLQV